MELRASERAGGRAAGTFLGDLLGLAEQAVEDGAEVAQQALAVLQQLQGLGLREVRRAVKEGRTWTDRQTGRQTQTNRQAYISLSLGKK